MTEKKVIPLRAPRAPAAKPTAKTKAKRESWTTEKKQDFLANLAATANVRASIRATGMSESAVYRLRQRSPDFRAQWGVALREGYARLELMLLERAMNGTKKPVFHAGQQIGQIIEYSDRLALTLLSVHRDTVMGEAPAREKPSHPEEVRKRILEKLAEMNGRLTGDA